MFELRHRFLARPCFLARPWTLLALSALILGVPSAEAQTIFADGFESGDTSAWSHTQPQVTACVGGTAPADALEGALGDAPSGSFTEIACLEIRNDLAAERHGVAWSGVPVAADAGSAGAGLTDATGLVLVGPGGRIASQFRVLSRWGAPLADATAPIRWLAVATPARVAADGLTSYSLRHYDSLAAPSDPFAASITPSSDDQVVDTGLATFVLDPANPALFESISVDLDDDGSGRVQVYAHTPGAGPRLVLPGGPELSTAGAGEVVVDAGGFEIVESGPVQVMVKLRGHFLDVGGATLCNAVSPAYERFGFTLVATFRRGSRDVLLHFHLRNECSDGDTSGDGYGLTDDAADVDLASFEMPFSLGSPTSYFAATGAVGSSAAGFAGTTLVEQAKGGDATTWTARVARASLDGVAQQSGEALDRPLVAVADDTLLVAASMPWMRYREPQAVAVDDRTVSLRLVSEPLTVAEGRGIWGVAGLRLEPVALATAESGSVAVHLESLRDGMEAELERRLLARASNDDLNRARLFPSLGTGEADGSGSPFATGYVQTMETLHAETVDAGGQWDRAKTYGSQLWPDVQFDEWSIDNANPHLSSPAMNYWNALGNEALEFLRSGEPKWIWDFTAPQLWTQVFGAYLNLGDRTHSNRNGVAVNSGGAGTDPDGGGEGHWHRSNFGSDDYTYDIGMHVAYAVHPHPAVRDRFAAAGRTVADRYSVPEGSRLQFIDERDVVRQTVQHYEMLANCAEFVPGAEGQVCHDRLLEIVGELVDDNLSAALTCQGDDPPGTDCGTPQQFMTNALFYLFFHRIYLNYGDVGGDLFRALTEGPRRYYVHGMDKLADGTTLDVDGVFAVVLDCDLTADRRSISSCVRVEVEGSTAVFQPIYPNTVAMLLMAHDLDPSLGFCDLGKDAIDAMDPPTRWDDFMGAGAGWWKASAQMMNGVAFGVGVYETCSP